MPASSHPADLIVVPKDKTTQQVLAREMEDWWKELDLRHRLWVISLAEAAIKQHQGRN